MLNNCIKNLLNLKELNVKKVKNSKNCVEVYNENAIKFYENLGMNIKNLRFEQKIN